MLVGIAAQVRMDNMTKDGCFGVQVPDDDRTVELAIRGPEAGYSGKIRDDLAGQTLHDGKVAAARATAFSFFEKKASGRRCQELTPEPRPASHPSL